jgi:hypothetical protein
LKSTFLSHCPLFSEKEGFVNVSVSGWLAMSLPTTPKNKTKINICFTMFDFKVFVKTWVKI